MAQLLLWLEWVVDHLSAMSMPDHSEKFPCKSKEAKFERSWIEPWPIGFLDSISGSPSSLFYFY
jgi:hypothetical protein